MSFSFYVRSADPPRYSSVLDAVAMPDCACLEGAPEDDGWAADAFFHFYCRGRSAREIEVHHEDGRFAVRIMTCSARADHLLAMRFVDSLAKLTGSWIEPEDGDPFPLEEREQRYGADWIERMESSGPSAVIAMMDRGAQPLTLSGPRPPFHAGPRFLR